MAQLDDVITYLEMRARPALPRIPAPHAKLALIRTENCTVSFYRYLYETVGAPWLWYERRLLDDETLGAQITKDTTEIFVLYVGGVRAGYFAMDAADAGDAHLASFGLILAFIGRPPRPVLRNAAPTRQ